MNKRHSGFTLIELIIVILLIGILAAFAVPQYLLTIENGKAQTALGIVNMIGTTNKMYALDHPTTYLNGQMTTSCATASCPGVPVSVCDLVACKYLAAQDFDRMPYTFYACNPGAGTATTCPTTIGCPASGAVAYAVRSAGSYTNWWYLVSTSGQVLNCGGAPPPP